MNFPPRLCPVCGGSEAVLMFHQRFDTIEGAQLLNGYDVVICCHCGAGFADSIPDQGSFDEYYRELSKYEHCDMGPDQPPAMEPRAYDLATSIEHFIPASASRILEIGSGSGQLLKVLQDRGFCNVLASDPSPACIRAAEQLYGVAGVAGSIFTLAEPAGTFDFVILIGVLEHIRDLRGAVSRIYDLLRAGGRVYIEVPDASQYDPAADAPFQEFSVEHVNFFSRVSLTRLMQRCSFRTVAVDRAVRRRNDITCRNVFGVFAKECVMDCSPQTTSLSDSPRDTETEVGLRTYIEGCRTEDARIRSCIEHSLGEGRMAVWGVGAHTLRLLAAGGLDPARIDFFVDTNPKYQGRTLSGIAIECPECLRRYPGPVLISSRGFQNEIIRRAREQYGLTNRFILLYEADSPL